jgi:hypothetical protein
MMQMAYFVIPHDIKHGDDLVCSYPACQSKGVKFCFCTVCNMPAAKPCFRRRHNHCEFAPPANTNTNAVAAGKNLFEDSLQYQEKNATILGVISNLSTTHQQHSNADTCSSIIPTRKRKHANDKPEDVNDRAKVFILDKRRESI